MANEARHEPRRSRHLQKSTVITRLFCYLSMSFIVYVLGKFCYYYWILRSSNLVNPLDILSCLLITNICLVQMMLKILQFDKLLLKYGLELHI